MIFRSNYLYAVTVTIILGVLGFYVFDHLTTTQVADNYDGSFPLKNQPKVGDTAVYHVHYRASGWVDIGGLTQKSSAKTFSQSDADLKVSRKILALQPSGWLESWDLNGHWTTSINEKRYSKSSDKNPSERVELLVFFDHLGGIKALKSPQKLARDRAQFVREIASSLVVRLSESASERAWQGSEFDGNGEFLTSYILDHADDKYAYITKKKLGYQDNSLVRQNGQNRVEIQGQVNIKIGHQLSDLQSISGTFLHQVFSAEGVKSAAWDVTIDAGLLSLAVAPLSQSNVDGEREPQLNDIPMNQRDLARESNRMIQSEVLKGDKLEDLFVMTHRLHAKDGQVLSSHERATLVNKLFAWLWLHPQDSDLFGTQLIENEPGSGPFVFALGALVQVGSAEAQEALQRVLAHLDEDSSKITPILMGVGQMSHPSQALEAEVRRFIGHLQSGVRSSATLALGNMASSLTLHDRTRSDCIIQDLGTHLESATLQSEKMSLILALGNAASSKSSPYILSMKDATEPSLRRSVARALRTSKDATSQNALMSLLRDRDEGVRLSAAEALYDAALPDGTLRNVVEHFSVEKSPPVRGALVRALWNQRENPVALRLVKSVGRDDVSPEVMAVARALLAGVDY